MHQIGASVVATRVRSAPHGAVYELRGPRARWFLKIARDLAPERERLEWLRPRLAVPHVVGFTSHDGRQALLTTGLEGADLAHLSQAWPPGRIVTGLAGALRAFHATGAGDCPFPARGGAVLVHATPACRTSSSGTTARSAAMWTSGTWPEARSRSISPRRCGAFSATGPGRGLGFLRRYGVEDANDQMVDRLLLMYRHGSGDQSRDAAPPG